MLSPGAEPPSSTVESPALSIVSVVSRAAAQSERGLLSLSRTFQQGAPRPYEVLVVEVESDEMLGEERVRAVLGDARYFVTAGAPGWRARAIGIGVRESRAASVGLILDAAHIVTPHVVAFAQQALGSYERPLVIVVDYTFDPARMKGAGETTSEQQWLASSGWTDDPYTLFEQARYGPAAMNGPLSPLLGASVLFFPKVSWQKIPGLDPALDLPGQGALRLHLFTQLCRLPGTRLVALAGEGAFRQTHPEVAAEAVKYEEADLGRLMVGAVLAQGPGFVGMHRKPIAFGDVTPLARPHVARSAALAEFHCAVCRSKGEPEWYEDES